ncbi:MAG: DbpA RNA binding domain-containing protein [Gemmatimonadota bacterium]
MRRGRDVAAIAAEGSGKRILYAFAALERGERGGGLQALVLCPTREEALRTTEAVQALGGPSGARALAFRAPDEGTPASSPPHEVLAARPAALLPEIRAGRLSLDALRLLVIDGVAVLRALGQWAPVEAVLDTLASGTQKILVTDRVDDDLADLLKRQASRARRWPEELFAHASAEDAPAEPVSLSVGLGSSRARRLDLLEDLLRGEMRGPALVVCREGEDPRSLRATLEARGLDSREGATTEAGELRVAAEGEEAEVDAGGIASLVLFGLPARPGPADALVRAARSAAAIVDTAHARQLELQAARRAWHLRPIVTPPPEEALEPIASYRQSVRRAIDLAEATAEMLVLEPLFEEFGAPRVAAAVSALHRRSVREPGVARPWADLEAALDRDAPAAHGGRDRGLRGAWARLWVGAGRRDDVRPADLVGAITGETGAVGGQIGKIDIRGSFSLVDVDAGIAERVIARLDGASIRGRQVRVRLDRES